ncbi:MAG: DUF5615 family PIN-like protein [Lacunisphaera sp.]|nr:DUF5615 family PIN-like protein [Lacunisphaera sp.]
MRRFLIDNQLPGALVSWLEGKGCNASHVLALSLGQASDQDIWLTASREEMVIISKDEDFARFSLMRTETVCVVWLRIGNCRTAELLATMERAWPGITAQLDAGARLIELH